MRRMNWRHTSKAALTRRLRQVCSMPANQHLSGKALVKKYFTGITRGGLIVHCWRQRITLPRMRRWPRRRRTIGRRCR